MLTPDQVQALGDAAEQITRPITEYLLRDIARRVSQAGQLTSTAAYQEWRLQQLGMSRQQIDRRLQKLLKVNQEELRELLTQSAEVGYNFDIRHLPGEAIPFAANGALQQRVQAAVQMAQDDLANMVQTLGMVDPAGRTLPLQQVYRETCDQAFQRVVIGGVDYNTAIRQACKNLAAYGVRTIDYESGVSTRLEAAVRRNVLGGIGLMQEEISQYNHDKLGANGWEISAHADSAPDHAPIQGKQYTDAAYTALNNSLRRRIGTLNCGHMAYPIILGISQPLHSAAELREMENQNQKGVSYEGRHYTLYEATQQQRKLERSVRLQKNRILVAEGSGDDETLLTAQIRLRRVEEEYRRYSKVVGLKTQNERNWVAGYGRKQAAQKTAAVNRQYKQHMRDIGAEDTALKSLADYYDAKYNGDRDIVLLQRYDSAVQAGRVSPLASFSNYIQQYDLIETELVGLQLPDGQKITAQSAHFLERVLGTGDDPKTGRSRPGVSVEEIKETLLHPEGILPPAVHPDGRRSVRYRGKSCQVSVNPDTGMLIQVNPIKPRGGKQA